LVELCLSPFWALSLLALEWFGALAHLLSGDLEQFFDSARVDWLDEVMVKPGLKRALSVGSL
jgi:hypothetical protein